MLTATPTTTEVKNVLLFACLISRHVTYYFYYYHYYYYYYYYYYYWCCCCCSSSQNVMRVITSRKISFAPMYNSCGTGKKHKNFFCKSLLLGGDLDGAGRRIGMV